VPTGIDRHTFNCVCGRSVVLKMPTLLAHYRQVIDEHRDNILL
jgi:hypothetical protein